MKRNAINKYMLSNSQESIFEPSELNVRESLRTMRMPLEVMSCSIFGVIKVVGFAETCAAHIVGRT